MRTTVGPLPSSVYWRRRAVVLGAALLGIIVLFVSCSGSDKPKQNTKETSASTTLPTAPATVPSESDPSFVDPGPAGGPKLPNPSDLETQSAAAAPTLPGAAPTGTGTGANTSVTVPAGSPCADTEMSLVPIPSPATVKRGAKVELTLRITNVGTRTCSRDVGADPQELYLDQGAFKYWSSDTCSTVKGNNVQQFLPGGVLQFSITWNGRQTNKCAGGLPAGPNPPHGQFELRARLGTLVSSPVTLTIVD